LKGSNQPLLVQVEQLGISASALLGIAGETNRISDPLVKTAAGQVGELASCQDCGELATLWLC